MNMNKMNCLELLIIALLCTSFGQDLQAQTTVWLGGTGSWCNFPCGQPQNQWSGGELPNNCYSVIPPCPKFFNVLVDGDNGANSDVTIASPGSGLQITIDSLTVDAGDVVRVGNASFLRLDTDRGGFLHNDGEIILQGSGNTATLDFGGLGGGNIPLMLTGSGAITLASTDAILNGSGSNAHLINTNNTIQGFGRLGLIGNNAPLFTNLAGGLVDANVDGQTLTLDAQHASQYLNEGIYRASGGGILELRENFDNQNTIEALSGSTVTIAGHVTGGLIRSIDTGSIELVGSGGVPRSLTDLTLQGTANQNESSFVINGAIDNQADIYINNDDFGTTTLGVGTGTILTGGGTITLTHPERSNISNSVGDLTNTDNTIQGTGRISIGQFINGPAGLVDANVPGMTLELDPGLSGIENQGVVRASIGGNLELQGGPVDNSGGVVEALDGSTVTLISNPAISGGTLRSINSGTVEVQSVSASIMDLTLEGTVNINASSQLIWLGTVDNQAEINVADTGAVNVITPVVITGSGSIKLPSADSAIIGPGIDDQFQMNGGTLTGNGRINTGSVFNGSTVSPGNSIGTLKFNGSTRFVGGTTLDIELGAVSGTPGTDWDFLEFAFLRTLNFEDDDLGSGVTVKLTSLDSNGENGQLDRFDPGQDYSWVIAEASFIESFSPGFVVVDASEFENDFDGVFSVTLSPSGINEALVVRYGQFALGDVNQDGETSLLDVAPFVAALFKGDLVAEADINLDGQVDLLDVALFVTLLSG